MQQRPDIVISLCCAVISLQTCCSLAMALKIYQYFTGYSEQHLTSTSTDHLQLTSALLPSDLRLVRRLTLLWPITACTWQVQGENTAVLLGRPLAVSLILSICIFVVFTIARPADCNV